MSAAGLAADVVQVWLVSDVGSPRVLADLLAVLDAEERRRAEACRSADDRRRFVLAHGALRHIAADRLGVHAGELRWTRGPCGKPEPAAPLRGARVNLSHSGEVAMVAVTGSRRVGVDVQRVLPHLDAGAMARRYFPPAEAEFVRAAADPGTRAGRFARLWCRKEALVKAHGGRLMQGLRIPVGAPVAPADGPQGCRAEDAWSRGYRIADVPAPPGYLAAVALSGQDDFLVTHHRWSGPTQGP